MTTEAIAAAVRGQRRASLTPSQWQQVQEGGREEEKGQVPAVLVTPAGRSVGKTPTVLFSASLTASPSTISSTISAAAASAASSATKPRAAALQVGARCVRGRDGGAGRGRTQGEGGMARFND